MTATGVYLGAIAFSRLFGQRQFTVSSSYDLIFTFARGSVIGRVVLVRTSLASAMIGLGTLFVLHAATGWLHHNVRSVQSSSRTHRSWWSPTGLGQPSGRAAQATPSTGCGTHGRR